MKGVRAFAYVTAITCALSSLATAQILPGRVSAASPGQTQLSLTTAGKGTFSVGSDVIFGNGGGGPYSASYKPINQFSETVTIDGRMQQRDFDYDVNYGAGSITFRKGVAASSVIRFEYSYDPSRASGSQAPLSIPVTLDLVKKQGSGLQFTGLYKQGDRNKSVADTVVYGLTGDKKVGQAGLTSMLLFSPDVSGKDSNGGFSERSAIKLGGSTKSNNFSLNTSYLRVGEQFSGAKDYNLQQATEALDMAASFNASKNLNLTSTFNRNEALAGEKKGEIVSTMQQKAVLTPDGAPKLTLTHTQVEKEKPNAASVKTTTDSMLVEHKLGTNLSATATRDAITTDAGGTESKITTNQLILNAKPADNMSLTSRLTQKDSSVNGGELGYGFDLNTNPNKTTTVKATMNRLDSDKTGESGAETLYLAANPSKLLNLVMNVAHANTEDAGDSLVHNLKIISTPRTDWNLELGLTGKNVSQPADEFAQTFMLSTTSLRNTTLRFNWAQNESDAKGDEQLAGVKVVSTPWKIVTVTGGLSQRETLTARDMNKEATLEVKPSADTMVAGAYKETETNGAVVAKVSAVSAAAKPVDFLRVSGGYKNREAAGQSDLSSMNVEVKVNTGTKVALTGSYEENPEDQKGVVQRVNAHTVGVRTDFGKLKLRGGFTTKEEYLAGKRGQQTDVGIDLRLSPHSLLTTSYSMDEKKDVALLQTSVYQLGYTHSVGSSMNLYLTGRMTTYEKDRMYLEDQTNYEAEARFGLKF